MEPSHPTFSAWTNFCNHYDSRNYFYHVTIEGMVCTGMCEQDMQSAFEDLSMTQGLTLELEYIQPENLQLQKNQSFMYKSAHPDSETINQLLHAETVERFIQKEGYSLIRRNYDGYIGWVPSEYFQIPQQSDTDTWLKIRQLRGHLYDAPRVQANRIAPIACGMRFQAISKIKEWYQVHYRDTEGYIHQSALREANDPTTISIAQDYLHSPYIWGGVTAWGLDCSGLVQTVFRQQGVQLPRDADQQEHYCKDKGQSVPFEEIQAGDIAFFPGHVVLCYDASRIIHANAAHMRVSIDTWNSDYGQRLQKELRAIYRL